MNSRRLLVTAVDLKLEDTRPASWSVESSDLPADVLGP